jgi:hypothetical protein
MKALAAEMTANFSNRLQPLGITVREFTGDIQLTKKELTETQIIVTTPEKWDLITRKSNDIALVSVRFVLIYQFSQNSESVRFVCMHVCIYMNEILLFSWLNYSLSMKFICCMKIVVL